jgi:hypothetical protein
MTPQQFARSAELLIMAELLRRGFKVARPEHVPDGDDVYFKPSGGEWRSGQIKSTSSIWKAPARTAAQYQQVQLYNHRGRGKATRSTADIHFVVSNQGQIWVIPTQCLGGSGARLRLTPKYDKYRDAWHLLREAPNGSTEAEFMATDPTAPGSMGILAEQKSKQGREPARSGEGQRSGQGSRHGCGSKKARGARC